MRGSGESRTTTPGCVTPFEAPEATHEELSSVAFAILGFCWKASTIARAASAGFIVALSASRRRRMARAWSC
jgi:hypothetical protein